MAINLRSVGQIIDGSISTIKLADGAVTTSKLADGGVSTEKLKDNAVSAAKAVSALATHIFIGDETELSVTGTIETTIKTFSLATKNNPVMDWKKVHVQALVKTNNASYSGTMKVYFNAEATPRITLSTTSTSYELQYGVCDISDLPVGKHDIKIKLHSANAAGIAYNELLDVFTEL